MLLPGSVTSPATGLLIYVTGWGFYYNAGTPASPLLLNITAVGNAFNGAGQLVQLNASGQLPAVSGTNITSLNANNLTSATVAAARLGPGSANNTTYLRGDGPGPGWTALPSPTSMRTTLFPVR